MTKLRGWVSDLAVGVRLAVGGGRTSAARFALSTVGIAIAVAVLLLASAVDNVIASRDQRDAATTPNSEPVAGVQPLHRHSDSIEYQGGYISVLYLHPDGPNAPIPPGLPRLPAVGEAFVSPAVADLLSSSGGERLRSRIPRVVGTIDPSGVVDPGDLTMYAGADRGIVTSTAHSGPFPDRVYSFGRAVTPAPMDPGLLLLLLLGVVALLVPVFIFVAGSARIAGAERDRRLAALRLVGADSRQVRRIAAAESLVSALAGLLLGGAIFIVGRRYLGDIEVFGVRVYPGDVVPAVWLVGLIVVAIPLLAVLTAQFALRRTIIEPLGVMRHQRPVRRRLWWRLALVALGVLLLLTHGGTDANDVRWSYSIAAGATLLLIGVPVLLPWVVERSVRRMRGGPASWQLAIRRLQLDSGTSARVVGGVAVVLAAAIALHIVITAQQARFGPLPVQPIAGGSADMTMVVSAEPDVAENVAATVSDVPGVRDTYTLSWFHVRFEDEPASTRVGVADCDEINRALKIADCDDGQVFLIDILPVEEQEVSWSPPPSPYPPGRTLTIVDWSYESGSQQDVDTWTVPAGVRHMPEEFGGPPVDLLITPGALQELELPRARPDIHVTFDPSAPEAVELARDAIGTFGWRVSSYVNQNVPVLLGDNEETFLALRNGLLAGAVFTLILAGTSLLALALEQIRERRRPLAVLAASGVQRGVLARSLLWQTGVPVLLGTLIAVVIGIGLAALVMRLTNVPLIGTFIGGPGGLVVDWAAVGLLAGTAILLALLVTGLTLPFLRSASRLESLRTE